MIKSEKIDVNLAKTLLSSEFVILKTDKFYEQTKNILLVDFFISKIAQNITSKFEDINKNINENNNSEFGIKIQLADNSFSFIALISQKNNEKQIIFYDFLNLDEKINLNDTRIKNYISNKNGFVCYISACYDNLVSTSKLYRVLNIGGISFPSLSNEQLNIVNKQDENIVVQGVAGSGKTNVCVEKLIWSCSKNYGGKILYSTFSQGLLLDTRLKVEIFKDNLQKFVDEYQSGNVMFLDNNKRKALENYLGIFLFTDEENFINKIKSIISYIENKVEYLLIEDLYKNNFSSKLFADEEFFAKNYLINTKNHQVKSNLSKIKNISTEIIYKEIYGAIFGYNNGNLMLTLDEYESLRIDSFSSAECAIIYSIAKDYLQYLTNNNYKDNNIASYEMLCNLDRIEKYSLIILDEVQDFTQKNLVLFKNLTLKIFCAGDALQMINPSYFSFGYLKNLLFEQNIVSVSELKSNYRNTYEIQKVIDELEKINIKLFGTHNFISNSMGVKSNSNSTIVYCPTPTAINDIAKVKFDNFTIVVSSKRKKEELRKILKNQEILTISEIKGLERDTVLCYNILTDNISKWQYLDRISVNRKTADENSVYRYYFNLFYVGLSRAKQNLFVLEEKQINSFVNFFNKNFECENEKNLISTLTKIVSTVEYTQDEYISRVREFIKLNQYENAVFSANKITDDIIKNQELNRIDIYKNYVRLSQFREAGIRFWEVGMLNEAKDMFKLSGDNTLIDLIDAVSENNQTSLNVDIIKYYLDVLDNKLATEIILDVLRKDISNFKQENKQIKDTLKKFKEKK